MLHKLVPIWAPHKETTAFPQPAVESRTTVTLLQSPTVPSVYYSVPTRPGFHHPQAMVSPVKARNSEHCNRSVSKSRFPTPHVLVYLVKGHLDMRILKATQVIMMNPDELLLSLPQASLATTQSLPPGSNYQSSSFLPPPQGLSNPSLGFPSLTESQEQEHKVSGENGAENCQPLPHQYFSPQGPTNTMEGAKFPEENLILLQILNGFLSDFPKLPITRNQLMDGKWSLTLGTGSSLELFQAIREASGEYV